jgi:hypothetical protein
MKKEAKELGGRGRIETEGEWDSEHERRRLNWSKQERRWRKERRHQSAAEVDDMPAPLFAGALYQ